MIDLISDSAFDLIVKISLSVLRRSGILCRVIFSSPANVDIGEVITREFGSLISLPVVFYQND